MTYRTLLIGLVAAGGCYAGYGGQQQQTLPEPVQVGGPPGGNMDQEYQNPDQPVDPQGYQQPPQGGEAGFQGDPGMVQEDPNAQAPDPQQDGAPLADVDDAEIDATLQGYGTWDEDPEYGRVWLPDATVVGMDFTPYDSGGYWVNTEYGMTFGCDYSWGWLPFHYGRWGWFGDRWGWQPGHQWGNAWVDWRHGNGMVGWRPQLPEVRHHGDNGNPLVRDHRHPGVAALDSHWHFQHEGDLGHGRIRGKELNNPAEGLHATTPVAHPPFHGPTARAATVMGTRHSPGLSASNGGGFRQPTSRAPQQAFRQPAYRQPVQQYRQQPTYRQPTYRQPTQAFRQPAYRQPTYQRPSYQRPAYTQQQRPTYQRPAYQQPSRTFAPSRPSYSAPSHFSAPSHSSPAPSHSSSPSSSPSHSSSSSSHHR